ncbi:MAG: MerR family transcriptional regulator [Gemmatimonadetes bacterium]|nr:MerR family transcriptional regulator [Gemmatimonadota bacterium]MBT6149049.1 MerR family transcriptional regulator [Gemmatimonadota bacterium]MBT7859707.1 MerR family transcriptional regulator [Gemmatimonadota bacterium]
MQIGDLAERAGVSTRTIRYYEELGILGPEERSSGGFRRYCDDQLRRLQMIQGLKCLGFELEQIRQLFTLRNDAETGGELAHQMTAILQGQQEAIDAKIQQYVELRERTARGITVLQDCQSCDVRVTERDCHNCEVYQRHEEVPDLVECAIFGH